MAIYIPSRSATLYNLSFGFNLLRAMSVSMASVRWRQERLLCRLFLPSEEIPATMSISLSESVAYDHLIGSAWRTRAAGMANFSRTRRHGYRRPYRQDPPLAADR